MKKHSGMRPHDLVILLKIVLFNQKGQLGNTLNWYYKDLAESLYISQSEVSESLNRSLSGKLIDYKKKRINRQNLVEFILHGHRYAFPAEVGAPTKGIPTAHSHPFMTEYIRSVDKYVWPDISGRARGLSIKPLYDNQAKAVEVDPKLYKLLALVDVLRVGKTREIKIARDELKKMLLS